MLQQQKGSPTSQKSSRRRQRAPLTRGNEGKDVQRLQDQLQYLGQMSEEDKATGHGTFGAFTEAALKQAEADLDLEADGVADSKTLSTLDKALAAQNLNTSVPAPLARGAEGYRVKGLQDGLHELGFLSAEALREGHGTFGAQTEAAVAELQKAHSIEEDGVVGPATWTWLIGQVGRGVTGKAGEKGAVVTGRPAMSVGDEGPLVRELERMLAEYGADIDPDGTFDKETKRAVKAFQEANQLCKDGVVNTATAAALGSGTASRIGSGETTSEVVSDGSGPMYLARALSSSGLSGEYLRVMWSIGMRESSGQPSTISNMDADGFGLFQIQSGVGHEEWIAKEFGWDTSSREKFYALMSDPEKNIQVMMHLSKNGSDLAHWGHYSVDDTSVNLAKYQSWGVRTVEEAGEVKTWAQAYIDEPFKKYYAMFPSYESKLK